MGTGTGANEVYIYVSQWKFFDECKFPEEVTISTSFCNFEEGEHLSGEVAKGADHKEDEWDVFGRDVANFFEKFVK